MKKIVAILMAMLMVMSVTVVLAVGGDITTTKEKQPEKIDQQIFENKELNVLGKEEFVADEILVKFKDGVGKERTDKINSKHGAFVRHTSPTTGTKRIAIPKSKTVAEMVKLYQAEDAVEYAEPNYIAHALMVPNDPDYPLQWHLDNTEYGGINMEDAWDISTGTDVIVAVIDTGVAYEDYEDFIDNPGRGRDYWITYAQAPDLAGTNFVLGYDFVNDDAHPNDDEGHGTHVTGTIAQTTNNEIGVAGVAFDCSIMPVKVLDSSGYGTYEDVAEGIYFAADHGAQVISMSLGGPASITLENAVKYAYEAGVTIVCASGNDGSATTVSYPAAYDLYCIAVGATRYDEEVTYYSNGGPSLDLTAPGGQLYIEGTTIMLDQNNDGYWDGVLQQTHDGGDYTNFGYYFYSGTSMATPHVSGVAALLISKGGATTPDEVREALQSTAEDKGPTGWDPGYGWGIVDAYAALEWTATPNTPPTANGQSVTVDEDTSVAIPLTATDPEGDPLTYSIVSVPSHGVLAGTAPSVTYKPNTNYNGEDSFTFKANDGKEDSNIATVGITVNPVNDAPIANDQSVETTQDTAISITLTGSDVDGDTLTFNQPMSPANGTLELDPNFSSNGNLTYTPNSGFIGSDSFTFTVSDGTVDSDPATISITVTKVNHPPVADVQSVTTDEDTPVAITLTATDPDGDPLTYIVVTSPANGTLSGIAPELTYTPELNFNGQDSFTFKANDGQADSNIATVSIKVNPINDPPVADDQSVITTKDTPVDITLTANDVDGDSLTYSIVSGPSHGVLTGTMPSVTYTPETGYSGDDSFTFQAYDGYKYSNIATVSITVNPVALTMHIASIDMSTTGIKLNGWYTYATATVTVVDANNKTVEGARVYGTWSGLTSGSDSGTTGSDGKVALDSDSVKNAAGTFTFTVTNVTHTDLIWDGKQASDSITV